MATLLSTTLTISPVELATTSQLAVGFEGGSSLPGLDQQDSAGQLQGEDRESASGSDESEAAGGGDGTRDAVKDETPGAPTEWTTTWDRFVLGVEDGLDKIRRSLRGLLRDPPARVREPASEVNETSEDPNPAAEENVGDLPNDSELPPDLAVAEEAIEEPILASSLVGGTSEETGATIEGATGIGPLPWSRGGLLLTSLAGLLVALRWARASRKPQPPTETARRQWRTPHHSPCP